MKTISRHVFFSLLALCLMASCSYISHHPALEHDTEMVGVEAFDGLAHKLEAAQ